MGPRAGAYEPSFGLGVRGGGHDQASYIKDLDKQVGRGAATLVVQMEEQKERRAKEEEEQGRDWWEVRGPPAAEYKGPHPSQVRLPPTPPLLPSHLHPTLHLPAGVPEAGPGRGEEEV